MHSILNFLFGKQTTKTLFEGRFGNGSVSERSHLEWIDLDPSYHSNAIAYSILLLSAFCSTGFLIHTKITQLKRQRNADNDLVAALRSTAIRTRHVVAQNLLQLVETDGAGSWPPNASHFHTWPAALRPYHEIYLELAPLLPVVEPSLDDGVNSERRERYRGLMREALNARIGLFDVRSILTAVDLGRSQAPPRDVYNGFYCCVSALRHAYRWATIPVVKVAQAEKLVDFPAELDVPWKFFQRQFGFTSLGGNVVSNFLCNFDAEGRIQYQINNGMSDMIQRAEYHFGHMFVELEALALPIYREINDSIIDFEGGNHKSCLKHLKNMNSQLRLPLKVFYERMHESIIPRSVWMSYVQGYQGWAAGEMIDGKYVEYDGLSGNQSLFFRAIDAFLGMESYLTDENVRRYLSSAQRDLCLSYKAHNFRQKSKDEGLLEIEHEMQNLVKQFKVFRTSHITRVLPYLKVPAPERYAMTAGKSVLAGAVATGEVNTDALNDMLAKRLKETV